MNTSLGLDFCLPTLNPMIVSLSSLALRNEMYSSLDCVLCKSQPSSFLHNLATRIILRTDCFVYFLLAFHWP